MSAQDNGGLAFPRPAVFTPTHALASVEQDGMTLRDYFAAKAIVVIYMDADSDDHSAQRAYELADAMLEARKK